MIKRLVIVVLALAAVLGGIFGWKSHKMQQQAEQAGPPPPATVGAAKVQTERWQRGLEAVGSLVAVHGVRVTSEVAGLVDKINFHSGEVVEKGDVLVELDDSVERAELETLVAESELAEAEFKRAEKLVERGHLSRSDFDKAQAELRSARAKVKARRAVIEKKQVRAPFSGVLGIRRVNLGEYLQPGSEIVPLQALDPIYVDFTLPEQHFSEVAKDQTATVSVRAYPERTFEGRIAAVDSAVSVETRNFAVRATLDNADHLLRPGMFAEVRVVLPGPRTVLTLPRTAVTYNPYGESVFVVDEDETGELTVRRRQIRVGATQQGRVEILDGLEAGQRVVSVGQVKLRGGQRVVIDNAVELESGEVVTR